MRPLEELVRPNIRALRPYSTARDEYAGGECAGSAVETWLDANENPFENGINRYPDPHQRRLKRQIAALKGSGNEMDAITAHASELAELAVEEDEILRTCGPLTAEDRVFLARHPERPHIDETINALFTDFFEQCGDRQCREDSAILGGIARFHGMPVTVIGHRKGSTLEENMACNFGMPGPEGYRKALRLMKQAEKFGRPIITFIDTPGAYPGKEAEERGQGEAIARNLMEMSGLTVPVIAVVTGEGSSGGALALAVADRVLMLENALYSVISPRGCASILWKDPKREAEAADTLHITAQDLYSFGMIEGIIQEGTSSAQLIRNVARTLRDQLAELDAEPDIDTMLQKRRAEMPGYFEDSFSTIAAYGANAAMMHYHAEGDVNSVIEPRGFLLVDNGGQYDCGTTDITRTYPVGPLTDNERRYYTWVLQSHIDMARAVFLDYCTGFALDTFARGPVWAHKVNYRCGTGHGVGFISGVHEGPQSLRPNNPVIFKPGMTITDEPGIYETDEVGIRIENELECIDLGENQYGHWLGFAPLTLVPISTEPVIVDELTRDQINWLNAYHAHVYEMLSPRLTEEEKTWLKAKTAPIDR